MNENLSLDQFPRTQLGVKTPNAGPVRRRINVPRSTQGGMKTGLPEHTHVQTEDAEWRGIEFKAGVYHREAYVPKISLNRAAMPHHN